MGTLLEYRRRGRTFWRGLLVLAIVEGILLLAWLLRLLSPHAAFVVLAPAILGGFVWVTWGVRWVRAVQPAVQVGQAEFVAQGKAQRRFVHRRGALGFGLPWGVAMAVFMSWHQLLHASWRGRMLLLGVALLFWVPTGLITGWLWGRLMWRMMAPKVTPRSSVPPPAL